MIKYIGRILPITRRRMVQKGDANRRIHLGFYYSDHPSNNVLIFQFEDFIDFIKNEKSDVCSWNYMPIAEKVLEHHLPLSNSVIIQRVLFFGNFNK